MPNRLTLLASVALLALSTPLAAQDTSTPEAPQAPAAPAQTDAPDAPEQAEAPAEPDTPVAPAAETGAETAQADAPASERPGQPYVAETHGDWSLRCMRVEEGETEPCQLYQLLEDGEGNAVAEVTVLPLSAQAQAAAGVTVTAPLGTLLTEALSISIDGGEAARYPFSFCNAAGCVSRFGLSEQQLSAFKRGRAGMLRIVPVAAPDQEVNLDMSLSGFTAGFDAVSAKAQ
ncbi:invasion associated locus B family protein [Limimaricola hongkongensis]|uniref:Invasion associated family protein n=1 Tax=Limimaricola hongkongensis DSM 17492 TaxID=1122180 RepID=A0A017HBI0_9RHOB|nr:invasion associated locus B family protein [Limimaricola hongkongensis]EYD71660.1 Invasion associated family protein [Limimaricola hongkongensis DSM 17492]